MFNTIKSIFVKGLLTLLPITITVYLIVWLMRLFESAFDYLLGLFFPDLVGHGIGLLLGLALIFIFGLILNFWIGQQIKSWMDRLLQRIPVVSDIYTAIKGLSDYLAGSDKSLDATQVVMVDLSKNIRMMGLVTCHDLSHAPEGVAQDDDTIAVFLPMSYQVGGHTIYLPRSKVKPVKMTKKDALRWTLMAGVEER